MTTPNDSAQDLALKKTVCIKVFGIGGAGCNAVQFAAKTDFDRMEFFAVNTDAQSLAPVELAHKLILGSKSTRGLGAGGDPELGRQAAEEEVETLRLMCAGADMVVILAGMGGGTGTGASPVVARVAQESGALVMAMVTLPFEFEGARRQRQAEAGLELLKAAADAVICLPNQKLFQLMDENTSVVETFAISNGLLAEGLRGVWRMLAQTGLINVDFADLCAVARGRHATSSFATAETSGDKRAEQLVEKLLVHPLLDNGKILNQSDTLLVSIVGGPDMTMSEVNKAMCTLNRQCENAHVIFGATIDPAFSGRISVTLIASRSPQANAAPSQTHAPIDRNHASHFLGNGNRNVAPAPTNGNGRATTPAASGEVSPGERPGSAQSQNPDEEKDPAARQGAGRKKGSRLQRELPLEIVFKGRFEKSEPTIRRGQDLDVPTYVRRGVALN
jgi:cell division protein FtsZ